MTLMCHANNILLFCDVLGLVCRISLFVNMAIMDLGEGNDTRFDLDQRDKRSTEQKISHSMRYSEMYMNNIIIDHSLRFYFPFHPDRGWTSLSNSSFLLYTYASTSTYFVKVPITSECHYHLALNLVSISSLFILLQRSLVSWFPT